MKRIPYLFHRPSQRNKTNRDWILADTNQHELQLSFYLLPYPIFKLFYAEHHRSTIAYRLSVNFKYCMQCLLVIQILALKTALYLS